MASEMQEEKKKAEPKDSKKEKKQKKKSPKAKRISRGHSIKKHTRTVKETVLYFSLGAIVCIYLGLLCGASYIPGQDANEFFDTFYHFVFEEHHLIVGVTTASPKFILAFLSAWFMAFILIFTKIEHPFAGEEYGSAHWGDARTFSEEYACHNSALDVTVNTGKTSLTKSLTVNTGNYWIAEGVYLSVFNEKTSNLNMLVIGPPGSGKSFRLARPILSQLCGNFLVTDPKGELYKQTGQYFEDNGYEVMVLNVESEEAMSESIHFNPFSYIRNESDIMSIAQILMKATAPEEDSGGGNDQFFEQSAEVLLTSLIYLIHYYYPVQEQNWDTFVKLLDATTVFTKPDGSIDNKENGILSIMRKAQEVWKKKNDTDFPGYVAVEKYYNGAAETTSSIVASLDAHARYMKLSCVRELLSEDEIKIRDAFGYCRKSALSPTGKRILFIVTSEDKRYYDWIPSMVYSLFFDELYHITSIDPSLHESLPEHLTFLMDEFSNVTLPDSFVAKLSTMRSRNMSAVIIVQNLIQLKRKFPKFDMDKDLIGNCAVIDILGAPDMDSCEYLSKHFGTQTIHKASDSDSKDHKGSSSRSEDVMQKPLLSAEDIFAMKKDGECAIVVKGADPLYQTKCKLENTDFVKLLCRKKDPYNPRRARDRKRALLKSKDTFFLSGVEAKRKKEELLKENAEVITLSEEDLDLLAFSMKDGKAPKTLRFTKEQREKMKDNFKRFKEKNEEETLNYDIFREDGAEKKEVERRILTARALLHDGFTKGQVRAYSTLIVSGYSKDDIEGLFSPDESIESIRDFMGNL